MLDKELKRFAELTDDTKLKRIRELYQQKQAIEAELAQIFGKKPRKPKQNVLPLAAVKK